MKSKNPSFTFSLEWDYYRYLFITLLPVVDGQTAVMECFHRTHNVVHQVVVPD